MPSCTRRLTFSAGHRVLGHEGKCRMPHGHNYAVEITAEAHQLDSVGRVVDFGVIKEMVGQWIEEHWDHGFIVCSWDADMNQALGGYKVFQLQANPTAENLALHILKVSSELLKPHHVRVTQVRVHETENCYADAVPD